MNYPVPQAAGYRLQNLILEFMKIEQDIDRIKALAWEMDEENWHLRAFLKGCNASELDRTVYRLHREFASRIDCTTCANCCKEVSVSSLR